MAQAIVAGLVTGSLYALAAFGLVLIFRTSGIVNFAQGEMAMFTTFVAYTMMAELRVPYPWAFGFTVLLAGIGGLLIEHVVIRPLFRASPLNAMIATLGLIMVLSGVAGNLFGFETRSFPRVIEGPNILVGEVSVERNSLFVLGLTVAMMALFYWLFKFTMWGLAIRAVAQDPETARLMGVRVRRVYMETWVIAAMLGAIAGMLIAPTTFLHINMMSTVHLKAFCAAVLGGFDTFQGPLVGGLLLGIIENLFGRYVSLTWKTVFAFALIVAMLILRPHGLCGRTYRKKV